MSNFLNILYLSVFFSLEDNRQASKWGGWGILIYQLSRYVN